MPTDSDIDATIEGAPAEPPAAAPAPAPAPAPGISREEARTLVGEAVRGVFDELRSGMQPQQPPAPRPEPEPADATADEFATDLPTAIAKTVKKALHPMQKQLDEFRNFGVTKLADLTGRVVSERLPYYKRYQKEIDAKLAGLDPVYRSDAATIQLVHDSVVANHTTELVEEARRQGQEAGRGDAPRPGGSSRSTPTADESDSPEALGFSADQIDEMKRIGRGNLDEYARTISDGRIKDWKAYTERHKKAAAAPKRSGRAVIPFARLESRRKGGQNG